MIKLRAITLNDSEKLFSYRENKALRDMFLGNIFPNTPELEKKWIENLPNREPYTVTLGIENQEKEFVGFIQLKNIDYINRNAELAILIGEEHQGKSYGKLAAKETLRFAFDSLNLNKIYVFTLKDNDRALKFFEKAGFKQCGIFTSHIFRKGRYHDLIILELIND